MTSNSGKFDILLQGGHVIDPANEIDGPADVGIRDRKIAAVGPGLSSTNAEKIVDVTGLLVTPGLIDMHTHHFGVAGRSGSSTGGGYMAWIFPDEYAFPNGITTVVDAGGAGYKNFHEFKTQIIDKAQVRVLALLNIVGGGMLGPVEQDGVSGHHRWREGRAP